MNVNPLMVADDGLGSWADAASIIAAVGSAAVSVQGYRAGQEQVRILREELKQIRQGRRNAEAAAAAAAAQVQQQQAPQKADGAGALPEWLPIAAGAVALVAVVLMMRK